jgi:hypothetical protein
MVGKFKPMMSIPWQKSVTVRSSFDSNKIHSILSRSTTTPLAPFKRITSGRQEERLY